MGCLILVAACATTQRREPLRLPAPEPVELKLSSAPDQAQFNVSLQVFSSERDLGSALHSAQAQVRSVETRYLPYVLKRTLDRSGYWGAVRVLPRADPSAEILVTGRIEASDGVELKLHVKVADATGRVWIDQPYSRYASELEYLKDPSYLEDPFQDLFNRIANDMSDALSEVSLEAQSAILDTAMLRYAMAISPESFSRYLGEDESGNFSLVGLPARNDPIFNKVERIRESEYLFTDSVDAHYENLFREIGPTYAWWRYFSYELILGNRRLEHIDVTRGATKGSWYAMERIYKTYKESKMNEDALRELTGSFDRETRPTVARISGRVVQLSGTLDTQYEDWRRILREIYEQENTL